MAEANALTDKQREYREVYLRSEHWRETRAAALERAENRCQMCSGTKQLDVHHNTYERIGQERPADLLVLCRRCHDLFHGGARVKPSKSKAASSGASLTDAKREKIAAQIVVTLTARGPLTSRELAQHIGCPHQQISAIANRMRGEGVLERGLRKRSSGKRWALVGLTNSQPRPRAPMPGVRQVSAEDRARFDQMREAELERRRADKRARAERRAEVNRRRTAQAKAGRDWRDEQQLPRKDAAA